MSNSTINDILKKLQHLKVELENEIDTLLEEKRQQFQYSFEQGKVKFEKNIKELQRRTKTGVFKYLRNARLGHLLTAPFIYALLFPFALLDIAVTIYQQICFRVYGIQRVSRKDYFVIDRQQLSYLNAIEKFHCVYCGYCNALIEYVREIAARTEQYWCPIKHARRTPDPHRLVENFLDYGDTKAYETRLQDLQLTIEKLKSK